MQPFICLVFGLTLGLSSSGLSAETNPPPSRSSSSSAAVGTNLFQSFQLEKGFRIELVASDPMVESPVAMAFDENGRLFVVEMRISDGRGARSGRVRMLDNMNEEGVFQNSTIYAGGLDWPSAVACYAGGIFVAAAPDIFYFKDTKGDGVADARQVVISGFGGTNTLDPNLLPNNFNWGPDNRIHGASAGIGGDLSPETAGSGGATITRCDFSFDPRTLEIFAESGPAESGLSFDSRGRKFVCDFLRPLLSPMYEVRYTLRNPFYPRPPVLGVVADPALPIYRFVARPPRDESGRQATNVVAPGMMTSARGCVVYRGRAFPTSYFDNVFIADPDAHVIRRLVLHEEGMTVTAQRPANEANTEFLISRDPSFRPVQLINGPDGALYMADMQNGNDRGRIYRILPDKLKRAKPAQLGKVKTYDLVSTLAQGDGWHRDTAARLLYERKDPAAPALLRGTLNRAQSPQARVLALHALVGAGALTEDDALQALRDPDDRVREHGLLASETLFKNGDAADALLGQLGALAMDPSLRVRYQLAFTLGDLQRADKASALGRVLARDLGNPWIQNAVLSSAANAAGNLLAILAGDVPFRNDPVGFEFLRKLTAMIGVSGHQDAVAQAANFIARAPLDSAQVYALLYDLGEGLYRTRSSLALVDTQGALQNYYSSALNLAADPTASDAARTAATRLLGVSTMKVGSVADWLLLICSPPTSPELQSAAIETLSRYEDPQVVNAFVRMWPLLVPIARTRAITALLSREGHVTPVLDAIQNGRILASDLTSAQHNYLRTYPLPAVRLRALQLLGPVPVNRPELMQRFKPALNLRGAADRGREIFRLRCAGCHLQDTRNLGNGLGPELLRARTLSKDQLLSSILEPNLAVRPDYATQVVESKEGQRFVGILTDENNWSLTLKQIDGSDLVWPQLNVRSVSPQTWSLMPDGLEQGMSVQDMADLMAYVLKGTN